MMCKTYRSFLILINGIMLMYVPACMAAAVVDSGSANKMLMRRKAMQNDKDNHLPGDAMAQQHQEAESTDARSALLLRKEDEQQQSVTIKLEGLVMPREDEDNRSFPKHA